MRPKIATNRQSRFRAEAQSRQAEKEKGGASARQIFARGSPAESSITMGFARRCRGSARNRPSAFVLLAKRPRTVLLAPAMDSAFPQG
jgi:hypothetical protein